MHIHTHTHTSFLVILAWLWPGCDGKRGRREDGGRPRERSWATVKIRTVKWVSRYLLGGCVAGQGERRGRGEGYMITGERGVFSSGSRRFRHEARSILSSLRGED